MSRPSPGVVEITRGCGRGCQFCSPATKVGRSFPLEHIVESARVNAREGATEVLVASEDMFLYEQLPNFETNVPALEELFRGLIGVPGIETSVWPIRSSALRRGARVSLILT